MLRLILMRTTLLLVLLVASTSVACKNKDATPPGTVVLSWDRSRATRATFVTGTPGPTTNKDIKIEADTDFGKPRLSLHLETADVTFEEGGKSGTYSSAVVVTAKVDDAGDFAITGKCDGPNYQMPNASGDTPKAMALDCSLNMVKGQSNAILGLQIYGDGNVIPSLAGGKVELK